MLQGKTKLLVRRVIWLIVWILGFVIPIYAAIASFETVEIISDDCYVDYLESMDESICEVEVLCDKDVSSSYITVAFYDVNGDLLGGGEKYFLADDNQLSSTFYIEGEVDSYEILDYDIETYNILFYLLPLFLWIDFLIFIVFISTLLLSCKRYEYNGNVITVYAGYFHHYISINGIKLDEHNTLVSFSPIYLSSTLDDGTLLNATITLTNRISLKINNRLYNKK